MSKWTKEDRANYNNSEVFQEFEKRAISNIHRLDLLRKKAEAAKTMKETADAAKAATTAVKELNEATKQLNSSFAEDHLSEANIEDEVMLSGASKDLAEKMMNESMDDEISDVVVNELMEMKEAAIKEGNIKLAYKIERTLDEILSVETI